MKIMSNKQIYNLKECNKFSQKLIGFMFKKEKLDYGLLFDNCSIHTFFCFQPLDIIMIDKDNKILMYDNVKPNKIILKKKNIKYIIEFSHNLLDLNDIKILF